VVPSLEDGSVLNMVAITYDSLKAEAAQEMLLTGPLCMQG